MNTSWKRYLLSSFAILLITSGPLAACPSLQCNTESCNYSGGVPASCTCYLTPNAAWASSTNSFYSSNTTYIPNNCSKTQNVVTNASWSGSGTCEGGAYDQEACYIGTP